MGNFPFFSAASCFVGAGLGGIALLIGHVLFLAGALSELFGLGRGRLNGPLRAGKWFVLSVTWAFSSISLSSFLGKRPGEKIGVSSRLIWIEGGWIPL